MLAAALDRCSMLDLLLQCADLDHKAALLEQRSPHTGYTALCIAIMLNNLGAVDVLLSAG
jgi:Ankyrin repeat